MMNCSRALVILVCMGFVVGSEDFINRIKNETFPLETMLRIVCPEGKVLKLFEAGFGDSEHCTYGDTMEQTADGLDGSCNCGYAMSQMVAMVTRYEAYYHVEKSNALIHWVSSFDITGNDCPDPVQDLWVVYFCDDPIA